MIQVRTRPQYYSAVQWDGTNVELNGQLQVVLLETLTDPTGNCVGALIKDNRPIANVVKGNWIVFNSKALRIVDPEYFSAEFVEQQITDVFVTDATILLPYTK